MKKKIALVTGGYSGESVISYQSTDTIFNHTDKDKWDCYLIDIHPEGWFYKTASGEKISIDKNGVQSRRLWTPSLSPQNLQVY